MSQSIMPKLGFGTFRLQDEVAYQSVLTAIEEGLDTSTPRKFTVTKKLLAERLKTVVLHVVSYLLPPKYGMIS